MPNRAFAKALSPAMARGIAVLALLLGLAGACSSEMAEPQPVDMTELIDAVTPTAIVFDPSDPPRMAGTTIRPNQLEAGQCFNEYLFRDASDFRQQVTTVVSCDGPHDREAYFRTDYPGGENARYPANEELDRWADTTCLDQFDEFAGLDYVLSELEIGAVVPEFESWVEDGDRAVICYVFPDQGGRFLVSVRGRGI